MQNDLKRIIAFSTISQLGYNLIKIFLFIILFYILNITINKIFYLEPYLIHSDFYFLTSFFIKPNIYSKNLIRYLSTQKIELYSNIPKLEPWFITGFTDAEGCFSFSLLNSKNNW